jgi:hypothetical protein
VGQHDLLSKHADAEVCYSPLQLVYALPKMACQANTSISKVSINILLPRISLTDLAPHTDLVPKQTQATLKAVPKAPAKPVSSA